MNIPEHTHTPSVDKFILVKESVFIEVISILGGSTTLINKVIENSCDIKKVEIALLSIACANLNIGNIISSIVEKELYGESNTAGVRNLSDNEYS